VALEEIRPAALNHLLKHHGFSSRTDAISVGDDDPHPPPGPDDDDSSKPKGPAALTLWRDVADALARAAFLAPPGFKDLLGPMAGSGRRGGPVVEMVRRQYARAAAASLEQVRRLFSL
jgi:hypothetical protein